YSHTPAPRHSFPTRRSSDLKNTGPAMFSRTTDGGLTWAPAYALVQPANHYAVDYSQVLVLPNGTLVDLYLSFYLGSNQSANNNRSEEHTSELQSLAYLVCRP